MRASWSVSGTCLGPGSVICVPWRFRVLVCVFIFLHICLHALNMYILSPYWEEQEIFHKVSDA